MLNRLNIICCVEAGILEQQALLLVKSASRWLAGMDYVIHAYSPRKTHWPSQTTIDQLLSQNVIWHNGHLNTEFHAYPIANKVLACQHFEQHHPGQTNTMFLDTDTVFVNSIDQHLLDKQKKLYLRPVDNKGPGSESAADRNDQFWQAVFALCAVSTPEPTMTTTVRPATIRPYFNAGLIWSLGLPGFFQQWHTDFMTIVGSDLRPFGYQSRDGDDFRCLDQVALAVTAARYAQQLETLPETYNYPLPFRPMMGTRAAHPGFNQLVHIHYHKWFQHPDFLAHVASEEDQSSDQFHWLSQQLPIKPLIDDLFKV